MGHPAQRHEHTESRMRGNTHVRFGGRTAETHPSQDGQGAAVRPYERIRCSEKLLVDGHFTWSAAMFNSPLLPSTPRCLPRCWYMVGTCREGEQRGSIVSAGKLIDQGYGRRDTTLGEEVGEDQGRFASVSVYAR